MRDTSSCLIQGNIMKTSLLYRIEIKGIRIVVLNLSISEFAIEIELKKFTLTQM